MRARILELGKESKLAFDCIWAAAGDQSSRICVVLAKDQTENEAERLMRGQVTLTYNHEVCDRITTTCVRSICDALSMFLTDSLPCTRLLHNIDEAYLGEVGLALNRVELSRQCKRLNTFLIVHEQDGESVELLHLLRYVTTARSVFHSKTLIKYIF